MVKIICSTKEEKEEISRLMRLGELIVLGVEIGRASCRERVSSPV